MDIVKEVARECPLPINQDTTLEAQEWILHTQIAEEIEAASKNQVVICDRSVLDNYAYLTVRAGRRKEYDTLVKAWAQTYDGLFKVPILTPPSFDGTRDVSAAFQAEVDRTIDGLVGELGVTVHRLDPRNRDGWLDAVLAAMKFPAHPPQIDLFSARTG